MKFFKLTMDYLFRKKTAGMLGLTAVLPAFIIAMFLRPMSEISLIVNAESARKNSFLEFYFNTTGLNSALCIPRILALLFFVCLVAVLVATVDRHMRIGDLKFRNPLVRINENFWVIFPVFAVLILVKEFFDILAVLFSYLWLSVTSGAVTVVLILISYALVYFLFLIIMSLFLLWIPHTLNTGLSAQKSFAAAVKLANGNILKLTVAMATMLIPLALLCALGLLIGGFGSFLISVIFYFVLSIYFVALVFVAYYEVTGIEREDLNNINIWEKTHSDVNTEENK